MNSYENLLQYLKGKSVAVVGSGSSILGKGLGEYINKHDIVVRINRGYPYKRYRIDVGSRTDIWSFGMGGDFKNKSKMSDLFSDRKFSVYHWWDHKWVPDHILNRSNHVTLPAIFSKKLAALCGGKPATTGVECVNFLALGSECKSITALGIDFYKTGYWFIEEDDSIKPTVVDQSGVAVHDSLKEEEYFTNLVSLNNNIRWIK